MGNNLDESSAARRPIGVAATTDGLVIVVCSDGAVFAAREGLHLKWEQEQPIPGTPADESV